VKAFIKGMYTDALGRPEPKMILGTLYLFADLVYAVYCAVSKDAWNLPLFSGVAAVGGSLMGLTAVADAFVDSKTK
jgi:hypothetical protein